MRAQTVRIARRHARPRKRHVWRWILLALVLLLLAGTGGAAAGGVYFASHLPKASAFHPHYAFQDVRIYDARGGLLYDMADLQRKSRGYRVVVPLQARNDRQSPCSGGVNRIPLILQNATIATEDATFYKNPGFDPFSIVRAAYQDVRYGHIVSGASTITQQVVRDYFLHNRQRTFSRKAQEVALAYEISKLYSKRKILWYYLNSVFYGNLAYGAQAAARVYFGEQVCHLDLAQSALIAGLPRGPSLYNPMRYRSAALGRMRTVLHLMTIHGYIHSQSERTAAIREASRWRFKTAHSRIRYPQFVQYVISRLRSMPQLRSQINRGIDVYTTLDPQLQDTAQRTVTSKIGGLTAEHVTDGALVSLDLRPQHYGWILAMVGSANYRGKAGQVNMAVRPRQPGSSMKPFNYIWAFTHGDVGPGTTVVDSPISLPDPGNALDGGVYAPTDYDHQFHGTVTVRQALANSLNVPAVKVEYYVTSPKHVAQTAARFGMTSLYHDNPGLGCDVCWAVTLGGLAQGTRLVQETAAYGVFATSGWTVPPTPIWKVVKRSTRKILACSSDCPKGVKPTSWLAPKRQRVLDASHAYEMTSVLSDNNARCTIQVCEFGLNSPLFLDRPSAAKTGTTNSFTDNWTVGYTPQIVTGVWAGNADRSPMINVIGVTGAAPIWHDFMESAFRILHLPVAWYPQPQNVVTSSTCTPPDATGTQYGMTDLQVTGPGSKPPLCAIPERRSNPAQCPPAAYGTFVTPQVCYSTPYAPNPYQPYQPYQPGYPPQQYSPPVSTAPSAPPPAPATAPALVQPTQPAPPVVAPSAAPPPSSGPPVSGPPATSAPPQTGPP